MGWVTEMHGDCLYHLSTVAGVVHVGNTMRYKVVGYVTTNDADELIAATGDVHAGNVIGSGYADLYAAKRAVDTAVRKGNGK